MRQFLAKITLLVASVAVSLALIEAFLVWDNHYPPVDRHFVEINGVIYDFLEPIDRFATPDPPTRRVMLIGDSFTAGLVCVVAGENVSGHLERRLDDRDIDLVNLGVEGRDVPHYVDLIEEVRSGVGLGDDVVVILYHNDILLSERTCQLIDRHSAVYGITKPARCTDILAGAAQSLNEDTWLKRLNVFMRKENVRTFVLVKEAAFNIPFLKGLYTREALGSQWDALDSDEFRWMVDSIVLMRDLVEAQGATFILAYYPNTNAISGDDPRHLTWRSFIDALEAETGITTLDPYPHFIEHAPSSSLVWSLTDRHPSCTAHGIMADYLYETVIDGRLVERP
jgi:hypothetical protein